MTTPNFKLSSPDKGAQISTQDALENAIQAVIDAFYEEIGGLVTGLLPAGAFDASQGHFPSDSFHGTFYFTSVPGIVDGQPFSIGDWLVPLKDNASLTDFRENWTRGDYSKVVRAIYPDCKSLKMSREPARGSGSLWETQDGTRFVELPNESTCSFETDEGVRLQPIADRYGRYAAQAFDVRSAEAALSANNNWDAFQRWVQAHDVCQTIELPAWRIPLGGPIDFGNRNVVGQGPATILEFSDIPHEEDCITFSGGTGVADRAGQISHLVVDANETGRDGIRWRGGVGCGVTDVQILNAFRDMLHVCPGEKNDFFERFFLDQVSGNRGAGRFGLCLRLPNLGAKAPQFINKTSLRNVKFYGADQAGIGVLLEDGGGGRSAVKIGGGISMQGFHYQYQGSNSQHRGAIYIRRALGSTGYIDGITMEDCTFESQGSGAATPVENAALVLEDENDNRFLIQSFHDRDSILTGWGRWWDYNNVSPSEKIKLWNIHSSIFGSIRNHSSKQFGSSHDAESLTHVPPSSNSVGVVLFDASDHEAAWLVTLKHSNTASGTLHLVRGGSIPMSNALIPSTGPLDLEISGTKVYAINSGNNSIGIRWSAVRILT